MLLKWRSWSVLPNAGGQREQRAGELERMAFAGNVYDVWMVKKDGKRAFMNMTDSMQAMLKTISRWIVDNDPDLADFRVERWAKLG